jgi:hypothetical protein
MAKSLTQHMQKRNAMQLKNGGPDDPPKGKKKSTDSRDYTYNYNAAAEQKKKAGGNFDVGVAMRNKQKEFRSKYYKEEWNQGQLRDSIATTLDPSRFKTKKDLDKGAKTKMRSMNVQPPVAEATYMARRKAKRVGTEIGEAVETTVKKVTSKQMQGCPPKGGQNSGTKGTKKCK